MVTGKRPFRRRFAPGDLRRVLSSTPLRPRMRILRCLRLDGVVARCLAKEPSARYAPPSSRGRSLSAGAPQSHSASAAANQRQWSARPRGASSSLCMMITLQRTATKLSDTSVPVPRVASKKRGTTSLAASSPSKLFERFGEGSSSTSAAKRRSSPAFQSLHRPAVRRRNRRAGHSFLVMEYVAGKTLEDHLGPSTRHFSVPAPGLPI